ncbi:hypothetical protein CDEF62S_02160 [Castellaniella defragrans]
MGKVTTMSPLVHSVVQQNMGIFMSVMPGARIFTTVTTKLIPVSRVPMPDNCRPQM